MQLGKLISVNIKFNSSQNFEIIYVLPIVSSDSHLSRAK